MQPQRNIPPARMMSPAALADPEARRLVSDLQRQVAALKEEVARLRPSATGDEVTVKVLCEARDAGGRTRLMARKLVLAPGTKVTAPFSAGEVEGGGGGDVSYVSQNVTQNVVNNNYNSVYSDALILNCGFNGND